MAIEHTIEPVKAANPAVMKPEFARTRDVEQTRGIKRGSLYNLYTDGKIKGFLLRIRGQRSGVRVWDLESIDTFIRSQTKD
jgi:predicted DNA-binding transcriptional regulator AlpA